MTPVVALLLVGVVGMLRVATDQLAVERVARAAARSVAVTGDAGGAGQALPAGGDLQVRRRGREVVVVATVRGALAGVDYVVRARAVSALEPVVP